MKTDAQIAARALRMRSETALVMIEKIEASSMADECTNAIRGFREESEACLRVADSLAPLTVS